MIYKNIFCAFFILLLMLSTQTFASNCALDVGEDATASAKALSAQVGGSKACSAISGITPKKLGTVWAALLSDTRTGGKRFDAAPPRGLPTGKILPSDQGVEFDLQDVWAEGVIKLDVKVAGGRLLSFAPPSQPRVLLIPSHLRLGSSYEWSLITRKNNYRGSFELPDSAELKEVNDRLEALTKAESDPSVRLFYQALIFDDAELYSSRDRALSQLRDLGKR